MSATLGIVVETLANDFKRRGVDPSYSTEATVMILPAMDRGRLAGWYSFRLAASTFTTRSGLESA